MLKVIRARDACLFSLRRDQMCPIIVVWHGNQRQYGYYRT